MSPVNMMIDARAIHNDTPTDFNGFIGSMSVRSGWDALFSLWCTWAVHWVLRIYFARPAKDEKSNDETNDRCCRRAKAFKRSHKLLTHLLLGLLTALTFNSMARGSGVAVQICSWIYFGIGAIWVQAQFVARRHIKLIGKIGVTLEASLLLVILIHAYIGRVSD